MAEKQNGLFDTEFQLRKIDRICDPLQKLDAAIDWEYFRPTLNKGFAKDEPARGSGGRPPFDFVLRFKVLILQFLYNLSDDAMKYQLNERRTFQRFIGLYDKDAIPDVKTIWAWRKTLIRSKKLQKLFDRFWNYLEKAEINASSGSIIDVSFVDKPRQRNTNDENDIIKKSVVADAAVHDSQALASLVDSTDKGTPVYADSAYSGGEQIKTIQKKRALPRINEKCTRNSPLTKTLMKRNRRLSKTRSRIEHVFGFMTMYWEGW